MYTDRRLTTEESEDRKMGGINSFAGYAQLSSTSARTRHMSASLGNTVAQGAWTTPSALLSDLLSNQVKTRLCSFSSEMRL